MSFWLCIERDREIVRAEHNLPRLLCCSICYVVRCSLRLANNPRHGNGEAMFGRHCYVCMEDVCASCAVDSSFRMYQTGELTICGGCDYWTAKPCTNPDGRNGAGVPTKRCGDCHRTRERSRLKLKSTSMSRSATRQADGQGFCSLS